MKRYRTAVILVLLTAFLLVSACKNAETPPPPPVQETGQPTPPPAAQAPDNLNDGITSADAITEDLDDSQVAADAAAAQQELDSW